MYIIYIIYIITASQSGNRRLAVRQAAATLKKCASSIAPHITTILVHGKQVPREAVCTQRSAALSLALSLALILALSSYLSS